MSQRGMSPLAVIALSLVFGLVGGVIGGKYLGGQQTSPVTSVSSIPATPASSVPTSRIEVTNDGNAIVNAVKTVGPAVVKVTGQREPRNWQELMMTGGMISGVGSGFIFEFEGRKLVISNSHVIGDFTDLTVKLFDGRELKARPLGQSQAQDLAVLELIDPPSDLKAASLGDSDKLDPGQWVVAIGNPFNFERTVTVGVVSAVAIRDFGGEQAKVIQTDAAINSGNSGGPLCDVAGNVVGINYRIYDPQGNPVATSVGIGFAIPINEAKEMLYFLVHRGPFVGLANVMPNSQALSQYFNLGTEKGIVLMGVYRGGPADKAGLRPKDVISAIDDKPVNTADELQKAIFKHRIGDTINFTIMRSGRASKISVVAGTIPEETTSD